ncbi:hypothetical protein HNR63_000210 [Anoxybacillus kamchatkensis]|uniref:hypothetical protein n=1 Tax=Anoxybacillus ayderensis TaxID=265546 RepID=UPI0015EBDC72|nr:hypothetical protein [Anoxybacillus ayderensis]MBA2877183.1 hypothetical protein [Anoxybacillus ayderensis]
MGFRNGVCGRKWGCFCAITSKSLKVTFSKPVDDTKAVFAVTKDGIKGNISKVTFAEDKKSATIELSTKLTKGEYTVQVTGLTQAPLTGSVSVEDEKVASIQILSENAPLLDADGDGSKDDVTVGYKVLNQYGEDITKTTVLTSNLGSAADITNGKVTITGNYKVGDKIPLTLINVENAVSATAVLTVSSEARVADIAITGLYNKDGKALNEDTDLSADAFYLLVDAKDQYGNAVTSTAQLNNDIIINETNNTVADVAATFTTVDVNGVTKTALKVNAPGSGIKAGTNTVTLISNTTGKNASFTVNVAESTRADVVTLSQPSLVVAGEDAYVPVSVTDKNGAAITDVKTLNNAVKGVKVTVGSKVLTNPFVVKDGVLSIKVPKTELTTDGYVSLVALSSTNKVATLTLNVKKAAVPTVIRGLSSDFGTTIKVGNSTNLGVDSFVIEDQYGRVMSSDAVKAWIAAGGKIIVSEDENSPVVAISNNPGDNDIAGASETVTVTAGSANGTEKLSAVLNDGTKNLTNSTKEFTLRVTDGTEYKSYTVDTIGTVYDEVAASKTDADAYDKTIKVYGVLADGSKVLLTNGTDYNVTSTNSGINTDVADGVIDLTSALTYDTNATTTVIPVKVTINATGQEFTQDVTFSKVAPKVASVALVDDNKTTANTVTSIKVAAGSNFDISTLTAGAGKYNLLVTDQYGVKKVAAAGGAIAFDDTTAVAAPTLTIVPVSGSVTITGNGTASASVTGSSINAGDAFDVKVTYAGGATTTIRVTAE